MEWCRGVERRRSYRLPHVSVTEVTRRDPEAVSFARYARSISRSLSGLGGSGADYSYSRATSAALLDTAPLQKEVMGGSEQRGAFPSQVFICRNGQEAEWDRLGSGDELDSGQSARSL